ncbi:MAG: periplasmic heavy metal sensor [Deltaproteobacteria bacterium]|nr:periplasmic heavy metal sensor [Deltaproteobacteria bacterium]
MGIRSSVIVIAMAAWLVSCQQPGGKPQPGPAQRERVTQVAQVDEVDAQLAPRKVRAKPHPQAGRVDMVGMTLYRPAMVLRFGAQAGVPEDKIAKIRQDFFDTQTRIADLEPRLKKARIEIQRLLAAGELDENKVFAQMDEVSKAETEIKKQRLGLMMRIRQSLTPEQRKKLDELKHARSGQLEANRRQGRRGLPQKANAHGF